MSLAVKAKALATIYTMRVTHTQNDRKKYPHPFFVSELERKMLRWMPLPVHVPGDKLFEAIKEVETLADWLEDHMRAASR